jgi:predicted metal-binding protein
MKILPADGSYTTFCDLVTGYRTLSVIIQAVNSGIIDRVGHERCTVDQLLETTDLKAEEGRRFVALLENIGILEKYDHQLYLSRFAQRYLDKESALNQRNVLEFEPLLIKNWDGLGTVLREGRSNMVTDHPHAEYQQRLGLFQNAMREAALIRAKELWDAFPDLPETGVIIDVGAGDGTYLQEFLRRYPQWHATACDLPDVCELHGAASQTGSISSHPCNLLDPTECSDLVARHKNSAAVLLLSNFIHCYSAAENRVLLAQLKELLTEDGLLIIHDFFSDGNGFSALYDLHMLVNTYNGRTYTFAETIGMLDDAEFNNSDIIALPSYSHAISATRSSSRNGRTSDPLLLLRRKALSLGFFATAAVDPSGIRSEPWVKAKCQYGCSCYGRKWSCPPHSLAADEFQTLLGSYTKAMVVAGQPPLRSFQEQLLELEKTAFLHGWKKALVFSGGPCTWCESCADDRCRFPEKRRPSLESCGCDVFALAEQCGIPLAPIRNSNDFIQYIGLLLVE